MKTVPTYASFVGGKDVDSDRHLYTVSARSVLEDVFSALTLKRKLDAGTADPAEFADRIVGRCAAADDDVNEAALRAAADAAPIWAATPLRTRIEGMAMIRERVRARHDEIVDTLIAEGNPRLLAQWQVSGMLTAASDDMLSWFETQLCQEFSVGPRRLLVRRVADGVVCVNPPQNAPASSALLGCMSLVAGNAIVVRAPRSAPLGVMYLLREFVAPVLEELGAPPGTLNVFCARPGRTIDTWLGSPLVDDIFYTGSVERGLEVERKCIEAGKKPILELSGNDCVVVWHDADVELAAQALVEAFYGSGQICMVPNQVVAHPRIADELLAALDAALQNVKPGYPDEDGVLLSPVMRTERFFGYVRDALEHGAELVRGGRRLEVDGTPSDTGMFLEPTVLRVDGLVDCRRVEMVREETFFPLLPVVVPQETEDDDLLDDVIAFVESNRYGLRNSLWSKDPVVIDQFVRRVRNGGLLKVNDSHIGFAPYLPTHGGTGLTGGAFGEANYPALRTSHLQGVSIAEGVRPLDAVFDSYRLVAGVPAQNKPVQTKE
ncbi:aldehyde dehydrogenase family protein [Lentzea sp. CA-135723]|uniref:aldehyde dehydrogenase family protein n=1 Tax=Lentzea sp. CA-135723 TaxID=3239950 RepID=UPI003D8F2B08